MTFDGTEKHRLRAGGLARLDPQTVREFRNVSETEDAVLLVVGGKDGYVGRDGRVLSRYSPTATPDSLTEDIEKALAEGP